MPRVAELALVLCLVSVPLAAASREAHAQEATPQGKKLFALLVRVDGVVLVVHTEDDQQMSFSMTPNCAEILRKKIEDGVVSLQKWVEFTVDAEEKYVVAVEPAEAHVITPRAEDAGILANMAKLDAMKPGDVFYFDDDKFVYDHRVGKVVYYTLLGGPEKNKTVQTKPLKSTTRIEKVLDAAPVDNTKSLYERLVPGTWYTIDGKYLQVTRKPPPPATYVEVAPDEPNAKSYKLEITSSLDVKDAPQKTIAPSNGTNTPDIAGTEDSDFKATPGQMVLDADANVWRMTATVSHALEGKLLIGGKVQATFKGDGQMATPAQEKEILLSRPSFKPGTTGGTPDSFQYQGLTTILVEAGNGVISGTYTPKSTDLQTAKIGLAVFPNLAETVDFTSRILVPGATDQPGVTLKVLVNRDAQLIPFADERAMPHLVKAYVDRNSLVQRAALAAMTANPGKPGDAGGPYAKGSLPFLLYRLYDAAPPEAKEIETALKDKMRDDALNYALIEIIGKEGWRKPLVFVNPPDSAKPFDARTVSKPETILARAIEIVDICGDIGAGAGKIFPLTGSDDDLVQQAARFYFFHRSRTPAGVDFVAKRAKGGTQNLAKRLLEAMEKNDPGVLTWYLESVRDEPNKNAEAYAALMNSIQGLTLDAATQKKLDYIVSIAPKTNDLPPEVDAARNDLAAIHETLSEVNTLRRDLATGYAARAVKSSSDRVEKANLLRRALALDPGNDSAHTLIAGLFVEIGRELREPGCLRAGPGDEYARVRPVKIDESLEPLPATDADAAFPTWRHVKAPDLPEGAWVHVSLIEVGKTQIRVVRERRPLEQAKRFFVIAKTYNPDRAADVDVQLAEIAAAQAEEEAAGHRWARAFDLYREAASLAPGRYRAQVATYYLLASPAVSLLGVLSLAVLLGAVLGAGRSGPPRIPPPGSAPPPAGAGAKATPPAAPPAQLAKK